MQVHSNAKPSNFQPTRVSEEAFVKFKVKQWRRGKVEEREEAGLCWWSIRSTSQFIVPPAWFLFLCASFHYLAQQINLTALGTSQPKL